ncbi:hypothetical protein GW916_13250 [bacterium]|nr:hypothetical protein [bacterium]
MNHSRANAPVRYCSGCGEIVNKTIKASCNETKHAQLRKDRNMYCSACGLKLR